MNEYNISACVSFRKYGYVAGNMRNEAIEASKGLFKTISSHQALRVRLSGQVVNI